MINKIIVSLINLLMIVTMLNHQVIAKTNISQLKSHKTTLYLGSFHNMPFANFCVLYDGEIIDTPEAIFTIKDRLITTINFLFVDIEQIKFCLEDSTVQEMSLKTNDYKFFQLTITQFPTPSDLKNNYSSSWEIMEKKIDNQIIPLNTIIIPLSPILVEIILQNVIGKPSNLATKLPSIKLTSKTERSLKELM